MHRTLPLLLLLTSICSALIGRTAWAEDDDPVLQLMQILREAKDYKQRLAAAIGLARKGDKRAVPALVDALEDSHPTVRGVSARVLGELGDPRAMPALKAQLGRDKDRFAREQAQNALAVLSTLPTTPTPPTSPGDSTTMVVKGTLGSLDQQAVQEGFNIHVPKATDCFGRQLSVATYLSGKLTLRFRIGTDGNVKWVRIARSDLGALAVEQCVLAVMKAATFDEPEGGEAEFTVPLTFAGGDPVTALDPEQSEAARQLRRASCALLGRGAKRLTAPPGLQLALYLDPGGKVVSAGLAAAAEIPAEFAEQLVQNLKRLTLPREQGATGHAKLVTSFVCAGK